LYFCAIIAGSTAPDDCDGDAEPPAPELAVEPPLLTGGAEPIAFDAPEFEPPDPPEPSPPQAAAPAPSVPNAAAPPRKRRRDHVVMCTPAT
jgi:hypothetical protein